MQVLGRVVGSVVSVVDFNSAALSGAIDIIVVRHKDGTYTCSPFHVRFGRLLMVRTKEKVVTITVNGAPTDLRMKLGQAGEAFFVQEADDEEIPDELSTSPIWPSPLSAAFKASTSAPQDSPPVGLAPDVDVFVRRSPKIGPREPPRTRSGHRRTRSKSHIPDDDVLLDDYPLSDPETITQTPRMKTDAESALSDGEQPVLQQEWSWGWGALPTRSRRTSDSEPSAPSSLPALDAMSITPLVPVANLQKMEPGAATDSSDSMFERQPPPLSSSAPPVSSMLTAALRSGSGTGSMVPLALRSPGAPLTVPTMSDREVIAPIYDKSHSNTVPIVATNTAAALQASQYSSSPPGNRALSPSSALSAGTLQAMRVELSSCLAFLDGTMMLTEKNSKLFDEYRVSYEQFAENPNILYDADTVYKIDNRLYQWQTSIPYIVSRFIFNRAPAPLQIQQALSSDVTSEKSTSPLPAALSPPTSPTRHATSPHSVRSSNSAVIASASKPMAKPASALTAALRGTSPAPGPATAIPEDIQKAAEKPKSSWWGRFFSSGSVEPAAAPDAVPAAIPTEMKSIPADAIPEVPTTGLRKTLRASSKDLAALALKPGPNQIVFSASSRIQGTQQVAATIYLWEEDTKICICDIDGTITRSDVLGQFLPILGKDWSHSGVAALLSNIHKNGYAILYLTARAIGQSRSTREYLQGLKQGEATLPQGPVIMTPDSLFAAFNREVIRRRPEEFKIAALSDIRQQFPSNWNPFYAGFGNRHSDALSYKAVHIPGGKIFIVSQAGELKCFAASFRSYSNMNELVNELFPAYRKQSGFHDEKYNDWNYWKAPILDLQD
eukprot:TRINITY_DN4983_c0_g1_i1.p1 TRINITY_DN4983_c0_g1~~TRINITY_DN4983_c0_g1_i1.p1  ORF type:complete len:836 (-),score=160.96 TRINITY_DN4983_c0_g1_i1:95-2602(-)